MSKQKQTLFVDVGRYRAEAYRRAQNDKCHIDPICLSYAVLFVHTRCMQNQQQRFTYPMYSTIIKSESVFF